MRSRLWPGGSVGRNDSLGRGRPSLLGRLYEEFVQKLYDSDLVGGRRLSPAKHRPRDRPAVLEGDHLAEASERLGHVGREVFSRYRQNRRAVDWYDYHEVVVFEHLCAMSMA